MKKGFGTNCQIPFVIYNMAERVGFEPTRQVLPRLLDFESSAFDQLSHLSVPTLPRSPGGSGVSWKVCSANLPILFSQSPEKRFHQFTTLFLKHPGYYLDPVV